MRMFNFSKVIEEANERPIISSRQKRVERYRFKNEDPKKTYNSPSKEYETCPNPDDNSQTKLTKFLKISL